MVVFARRHAFISVVTTYICSNDRGELPTITDVEARWWNRVI